MSVFDAALVNLETAVFDTMGDDVIYVDNSNPPDRIETPIRVIITEQLIEDQTGYEQNRFHHILNQYVISIDMTSTTIKPTTDDLFIHGNDTYRVIGDKYNDGSMLNVVCVLEVP